MSKPMVEVFTMQSCPYCVRAKELLKTRGVPFREILVPMDDDAQWDALEKRSGLKTMPQIFQGNQLIGGYNDLAKLDSQDELKSLK